MSDTSFMLIKLAEHDTRFCFVFEATSNRFLYLNPAFKSFFQIVSAEVSVNQLLSIVHLADRKYLKQCFHALNPNEFKSNIEFRINHPNQSTKFLSLSILNADQQQDIYTGYLEDITTIKAHSNRLNEYTSKKNVILNTISHDLTGPLGSIQNLSVLLARKTALLEDEEVEKWLSLIEKVSKKCIQLIQDFVKQERNELGEQNVLVKSRTNLVSELETIVKEYQRSEKELGKVFRFTASSEEIYAEVDQSKFLQAINNLVSNAIKFTPKEGTITVGLEEKEETILITVADNGIGIPKKYHAKIFQKFNLASRNGLNGETSIGLGMPITKTILDWHEGKIWFESEENKGSTFFIEIEKSA